MPHYRKKITTHSHLKSDYASRPPAEGPSNYKQKLLGSFFAMVFFLAILYGRGKHYTPSRPAPPKGEVDYSRPRWMNDINKIQQPPAEMPKIKNADIPTLVLILKEYRYWEKEVGLARKAHDKKKEEYAMSSYRQAMEKIAKYSDKDIREAEKRLERSMAPFNSQGASQP